MTGPSSSARDPERSRRAWSLGLLLTLSLPFAASAARTIDAETLAAELRTWRIMHEHRILSELTELLSLPNVASDEVNIRRNAEHLVTLLRRRDVRAELLEVEGSPPAVLGELRAENAGPDTPTVVFYSHYDGQPVDPANWETPPWEPTLRAGGLDSEALPLDPSSGGAHDPDERRLYARSASDDKAPIVAMLAALDALRETGNTPSVHLKFFFEGEEEAGSPHLGPMLAAHRDKLDADLWLFCDGPVHQGRRQQVVFGVRGSMGVQLTVYGPNRELHSGHYGNWAPNPGALLVDLLSSMRGPDGEIRIEGFYDPVLDLSEADRAALASVPDIDSDLRRELGLAASEADNAALGERILRPAINIRGLETGAVGAASRNAIPTRAQASIGFRLVPEQTPAGVREVVERHVRARGYFIVRDEPTAAERLEHPRIARLDWSKGYPALRTPIDHPASVALLSVVDDAVEAFQGEPAIRMPILGGSLPIYLFEEALATPLIVLPIVNHDNNQHAPNENLRLQNLWDGITLYASVMARLGSVWGE